MNIVTGEVLAHKKYGEHYHSLTIVVPEVAAAVKPGQFVNIRCGDDRAHILRRPFSIYRVHKQGGWASIVEIAFDIRGPGTRYLASLQTHAPVDLIGPLGRGFALPRGRARCLLVGGGIGAAPLFFLADELHAEDHHVDVILGARSAALLLNPIEIRRLSAVCRLTTEDGSTGERGRVTDVLADTIDRYGTQVVYTCGPDPMLAAVSQVCIQKRVAVQVAVEELMACGYGVCMTCVMPVRRPSRGGTEVVNARSCTEGPVFNGAAVRWDGAREAAPTDQAELSPAGVAMRHTVFGFPEHAREYAPPGN